MSVPTSLIVTSPSLSMSATAISIDWLPSRISMSSLTSPMLTSPSPFTSPTRVSGRTKILAST